MTNVYGGLGIPHGMNDTTPIAQTVFNAKISPNALTFRANHKGNTAYPHVDDSHPSYRLASKGTMGFFITGIPGLSGGPRDFNDRSTAYVFNDLNGLLHPHWKNNLVGLIDHITVAGVFTQDISAKFNEEKGTTIASNGKSTMLNTGTQTIHAGQEYFWDLPPTDEAELATIGANLIEDNPPNSAPLMTVPFNDLLHTATPLSAAALVKGDPGSSSTYSVGHKKYRDAAVSFVKNIIMASVAVMEAVGENLSEDTKNRLLKPNDVLIQDVTDAYLLYNGDAQQPLRIEELERISQTVMIRKKDTSGPSVGYAVSGADGMYGLSLPEERDPEAEETKLRIASPAKLFSAMNTLIGFYKDRKQGVAISSADPGRDFDAIQHNTHK